MHSLSQEHSVPSLVKTILALFSGVSTRRQVRGRGNVCFSPVVLFGRGEQTVSRSEQGSLCFRWTKLMRNVVFEELLNMYSVTRRHSFCFVNWDSVPQAAAFCGLCRSATASRRKAHNQSIKRRFHHRRRVVPLSRGQRPSLTSLERCGSSVRRVLFLGWSPPPTREGLFCHEGPRCGCTTTKGKRVVLSSAERVVPPAERFFFGGGGHTYSDFSTSGEQYHCCAVSQA